MSGSLQRDERGLVYNPNAGIRQSVIRIDRSDDTYRIETPESMNGLVYLTATESEYLISLDEAALAVEVQKFSKTTFSQAAIAIRQQLGQAPLAPTILENTQVLPPCAEVILFKGRGTAISQNSVSLIQPTRTDSEELIKVMLNEYREILHRKVVYDKRKVGVFLSGGYDSRLELAAMLCLQEELRFDLELFHIATRGVECRIVQEIAEAVSCPLHLLDARELTEWFFLDDQFLQQWNALKRLPTWRPSIPMYYAAARFAVVKTGCSCVVGYAPHSLKGRQYETTYQEASPPDSGLFRVVNPEIASLVRVSRELQMATWRNLLALSREWSDGARHDHILWALHNGFSYSHRNWPVFGDQIVTVNNRKRITTSFMGLGESQKRGTTFVEFALKNLKPELLDISLASSTGERSSPIRKGEFSMRLAPSFNLDDVVIRGALRNGIIQATDGLLPSRRVAAIRDPSLTALQLRAFVDRYSNADSETV